MARAHSLNHSWLKTQPLETPQGLRRAGIIHEEEGTRYTMEIKGTHKFAAAPQAVWSALHNPTVLKNALPGVEEVSFEGDSAISARVSGIGPLKGPYSGTVQVVENSAPNHMKITLNRSSVSGSMTVDLAPDGTGTLLTYNAQGNLNGALAMLDNPLTRPLVDGQVGQFFSRLESQIS